MAGIVRADTARLNTIKSQDSDVTAFTIASDGHATFTKPILQTSAVAFSARGGARQEAGGVTDLQFNTTDYNYGNNFSTSTYTWTTPVAGVYYFSFSLMVYSQEHSRCQFKKNSSYVGNQFYCSSVPTSGMYVRNNGEIIIEMAVNDTMKVVRNVSNESSEGVHSNYRHFTGMLIG
jgi:hypothetical protein